MTTQKGSGWTIWNEFIRCYDTCVAATYQFRNTQLQKTWLRCHSRAGGRRKGTQQPFPGRHAQFRIVQREQGRPVPHAHDAGIRQLTAEQVVHVPFALFIQGRRGLIRKNPARPIPQHTGEGDALLFSRERMRFQSSAVFMDNSESDILACMDFPQHHWSKIYSTNPPGRLNKGVKRRSAVVWQ